MDFDYSHGLEEIEGMRNSIRKLEDEREVNIMEARSSILKIKNQYNALLKEAGKDYCDKNCPEIALKINKLSLEFSAFSH